MDTYRESGCSSEEIYIEYLPFYTLFKVPRRISIYDFTNSAFYYVLPAQ